MPELAEKGHRLPPRISKETPMSVPGPSLALRWERFMPWAVGGAGAVAASNLTALSLLGADWRDDFLGGILAASAIFVAYLATAATIIPAIEEKSIVRKLKEWGYFPLLVGYFATAIWSSSLLLLFSLAVYPLTPVVINYPAFDQYFSVAFWGLLGFTCGAVARTLRLLLKLLLAR